MAKKNLKVDIDTERVDVKFQRKDGKFEMDIDGKNIDVHVKKSPEGNEVKVEATGGLLKLVGKVLSKVILRRIK